MTKSTTKVTNGKVSSSWTKLYPDFPLSYHPPSGGLYKKIRGKRHYLGYTRDWQSCC